MHTFTYTRTASAKTTSNRFARWMGRLLMSAVLFFVASNLMAQPLTGTKNIPGDYATLADAITDLNLQGVGGGGVTFNLVAGNPQTAPAGGYIIGGTGSAVLASSSAANPVVFEGNGNTITAGLQTANALNDAIFKLKGADYITLQNFVMVENSGNTTTAVATNTMTEWGVALLYESSSDGSQNNTIQNNNISLNRLYVNSWAVYSNVRHIDGPTATDVTTAADIINGTTAPNSGNKVYGNTISNVNLAIAFIGSATAANHDIGNDVGGSSGATGNTITNWSGSPAATAYASNATAAYGIFMNHQKAANVSYNSLTSASVSVAGTFLGIYLDYFTSSPTGTFTNSITNNTLTMSNSAVGTFQIQAIRHSNTAAVANAAATANINSNSVINTTISGAATGISLFGVLNTAAFGTVNLNSNIVAGLTSSATTAGMVAVTNQGAVVNTININNNQIGTVSSPAATFSAATSGAFTLLFNSAGAATANLSMSGNSIRGLVQSVTGSNTHTYIANTAATLTQNISNNTFVNLTAGTTGSATFISNSIQMPAGGSQTINNNSIVTAYSKTGAGGTVTLYSATTTPSSPSSSTHTSNGNNFSNITVTGATTIAGWSNQEGAPGPAKTISNNTFSNWTGGTSGITAIVTNWSGANSTITGNTISNITGQGAITAILRNSSGGAGVESITNNTISNLSSTGVGGTVLGISGGAAGITTHTISGNNISGLSSTGASSTITGINILAGTTVTVTNNSISGITGTGITSPLANGLVVAGGTTVNVTRNKICNIAQNGTISTTSPAVVGMSFSGGTTVNANNNIVGDLRAPAASLANAIRGISVTSTTASTSYNVYFNTVYLEASSTGATFGTSGIFHTVNATATTGRLDLRNNIIVNNSTPGAAGVVSAMRRSASATYGNYATTSNNNLLYAGTGAANRAILDDNGVVYGTAGASFAFGPAATVGTFQNQVAPRESVSFSETISGTPGVFFQSVTCGDPTFLHLVPAIVTQAEGGAQVIAGITNDFDNDTRNATTPDVGADEFSGVSPAPVYTNVTVPTGTCTPSAHVINADVTTISGTITSVTLNYNNGTVGSVPMTLVSGDTYTGTIPAGGSGVTVTWSITASNSLPLSSTFNGTVYTDDPLFGLTATASASVNPVCSGSPSVLSVTFTGAAAPTYTAPPAVTNPTSDEDFGNVTITQGANTILNNTTAGGSLIGTIGTATGTAGSYSNFTAFGPYTLSPGITYNISMTSITQGGNFGNALAAWIDYNRDGDFNDAGENIYNQGATITGPHTSGGSFTVPSGASIGGSRLRVLVNEGTISGPTITPSWGEYEEYAINIMPEVTAYAWSDGVGTIATTSSTTVSPTSATTYTATLTALGCPINSNALTVNVTALPAGPSVAPATQCGTNVPEVFATGTANGNYRWYTVPSGGTAIPGETGAGFTIANGGTGTYTISATTTFYVSIFDGTCESVRVPVVATVTNPDAVEALVNNSNPCANTQIQLSTQQTGSTNTYVYTWTASPETGSGITGSVSGSPANVTPTAGGTYVYTVTAVDAGANCTTTATVIVEVKSLPTITTATASPNPICEGASTTLTATKIGGFIGTAPVGSSTTTTQGGSPFRAGGAAETKTQILYTAAELLSAGFTAGNFSSIAFNFTTGSGGGLPNFRIRMGHSATTALTSTFETSPSTAVYGPVLLTPPTGTGLFTITFSSPFLWDGTSNVLLEFCHDIPSPSAGSGFLAANTTAFNSVSQFLGAGACASSLGAVTQTTRPIAVFGQSGNDVTGSFNWVWNPGSLSGSSVSVSPTATTTYTVTITDPSTTCSNTADVEVTVNPLPPAPSATTSEQCGTAVPTASVTSNSSATTPVFSWYNVASGGTALQTGTSATYTSSISTTTTFYVSEISPEGCEGPRVAVLAQVNEPDAVTAASTATTICLGASIDLSATQTGSTNTYDYSWTASPEAGSGLTGTQSGASQTGITPTAAGVYTYTVVASDAGLNCSTISSVTVTVNPVPTDLTAAASSLSVCTGSTIDLSSFANSNTYNSTTYNQDFESFPPAGWTFINAGTSPNQWAGLTNTLLPGAAHTGNAAMYYNWDASNAANAWGFTPAQTMAAGQTYTMTFWYKTASVGGVFPEKMKVTVGNNNTVAAQTTILWNNNGGANLVNETYAQGTVTYTPSVSGTYYFAFHCYSDADNNFMFVDDVQITGNTPIAPTYSWTSSPSGFTSSLQNPTNVVVNQTTTYSVTATNSLGCSTTTPATVTVTAIPLPNAPIGASSSQCGLGVPTASVSTGGANGTFLWYDAPTGGNLLQNGGSTYTTAINATTTFYVAEFDGTCESVRTAVTVTVTQPDAVTAASDLNPVCANSSIQLSATQTGSTNTYVYTWTASPATGSGIPVSASGSPVTVTPTVAGSYVYTVTAVDAGAGCTTTSTVTVTVNPNPVIDSIVANPATTCEGGNVSLSVYSSAPVTGPQSLPGTYCTPIQTGSANITSVTFNTLSNTGITQVSPFYDIYAPTGNNTTTLSAGATYSLSMVTSGVSIASVWIDYDRDGQFEATEWTQVWTAASSGSVNITIPANATAGLTSMRVRSRLSANANGSGDACTSFGSGVAQDYAINIVGLTTQNPAFTYTWNPGALNGSTVTINPTVSGSYTATILNTSTGCSTVSTPVSVTVTPVAANATASPSTPVCAGTAVTLNAGATGGAPFGYSWSDGTSVVGTTASIVVTPLVPTTYTVTVTDACSNTTTSSVTVTVNPLPTASIAEAGPITLCTPASQTLTAVTTTANPTYQWTLNGSPIGAATSSTYVVSGAGTGSYAVVVTESSTGCTNTAAAVVVTINPSPVNLVANASSAAICLGGSINLTSSADAPASVVLASQDFESGIGSWVTTNATTGANPATSAWTIYTNPYTSTNSTPVTFNSGSGTSFILSNPDLGGSGTAVNALLTSPSFSTIGMASLSLSLKHYYRLFTSGEAAIEVSTDGGTNWNIAKTYLATAGTPAAFATDNVDLSAYVGFSNVKVRFSYIDGWSWYWALDDIAVSGTPAPYTYSWTSSPAGFTSSLQNPTAVAPTVNTTYTVVATSSLGCTASASTVEVVVNARPTGSLSGGAVYCEGSVLPTTLSIAVTGTGPWSGTLSDGTTFSGSVSPITVSVTPSPEVTTTYTIVTLNDANCASIAGDLSGSATVTVNPLAPTPTASVTQPTCVLATGSITVTAPLGAGNSYTLDGTTTISWPAVTFSGVAPGPHTITVTNSFGCSAPASLNVTVDPQPFTPGAPLVTGITNVCPYIGTGDPITFSASAPGATSYTWLLPPNVSVVSGNGTANLTVTFANGFATQANKQIKVTASSVCGTSPQTIYYLLAQFPSTPGAISGPIDACPLLGSNANYSVAPVPGAASYIWTAQAGTTITFPNGTGVNGYTVNIAFPPGFTTSAVTVQAVNDCGTSGVRSLTVTRNAPSVPSPISGPTNACAYIAPGGTAATYSVTNTPGVTYNWTVPVGAIGLTGQGTNTITFTYPAGFTSGTVSVTASTGCGVSLARSLSISKLNPGTPSVIDVINTQTCPNREFTYTVAAMPVNATSIQWTIPSGAILVSGNGTTSITVQYPATAVDGFVTAQAVNNCGASVIRSVAVKLAACPAPPPPPFTKGVTEVAAPAETMEVKVFPNPTVSDFKLQVITAGKEEISVRVLDVQGRFIKQVTVMAYQTINLGAELKAGAYLIEVRQGKNVKTTRVLKF